MTETFIQFTVLLAFLANGVLVLLVVGGLSRQAPAGKSNLKSWLTLNLGEVGLWFAFAVAAMATTGSLIYSEGLDYEPCRLCWFQRIFMYPLAVVLGIAALRRDRKIWRYTIPLAVIGGSISIYHSLIEHFPTLESSSCSLSVPCSTPPVWRYGFVSLAYMALSGFVLIIATLLYVRRSEGLAVE